MVGWSVAYWDDGDVVTLSSRRWSWDEIPATGVLWVDVHVGRYRQQLRGMDRYWIHGDRFGSFNDPANVGWYPGDQAVAYTATGDDRHPFERDDRTAPAGARVLAGEMIPDDDARRVGLL